ncbi:MAG: hypothetical protein ACHQDY_00925 [Solirubrobacterales bacterium]
MKQRYLINGVLLTGMLLGATPLSMAIAGAGSPTTSAPAGHASSPKPLKAIYGPLTLPDGSSAFPVYRRLGVQVLELNLSWNRVAANRPGNPTDPRDPAYRWPAALGGAMREAARYRIAIALLVDDCPGWANGARDPSWAPTDPRDYADFMQAAARRYPSVRRWMILNEVNSTRNFNPLAPGSPAGPERYAQLLDDAYGALKAVDPANLVIGGMTYSAGVISARDFIRWMRLPDGRPPRMDYYGHNPYSVRYPDLAKRPFSPLVSDIDDIDTLHAQLAGVYRHHGRVPKLWLAEFGISDSANPSFDYYVSRAVQARWVTAAYRLAGSVSYVAALGWFELLDEPPSSRGRLSEGLMTASGVPKPAFYAYAAAP